jgi:predicted RNA binding protein YcfA (HicA-like mRNA interferase family)
LATAGVNGSHHVYGKTGNVVRLSIPIHANRPLKLGLLRHPAKLAEIPDDEMN